MATTVEERDGRNERLTNIYYHRLDNGKILVAPDNSQRALQHVSLHISVCVIYHTGKAEELNSRMSTMDTIIV